MSKDRISASVDSQVANYVTREDVNASGLINKLLKHHMNGGASERQMLEFRIEQVQSEIESLQGRLENKRDELNELKKRQQNMEQEDDEAEEDALDNLTQEDLKLENQKVHYWAGELGMEVDEFVAAYKDEV